MLEEEKLAGVTLTLVCIFIGQRAVELALTALLIDPAGISPVVYARSCTKHAKLLCLHQAALF